MTTYGYARISTKKQKIERQIENIKRYCKEAVIYQEAFTGKSKSHERPEFEKLLKRVKSGDTIIFDSVSRMSRNAEDGYKQYMELYDNGVELVFLKEPYVNTTVYRTAAAVKLPEVEDEIAAMFIETTEKALVKLAERQIMIAFDQSEKEGADISERTKEGIREARARGKQIGMVEGKKLTVKKAVQAKITIYEKSRDFTGHNNDEETMKLAGVSRNSYYKYKRELENEDIKDLRMTLKKIESKEQQKKK